jgi:hypothetical protein
MDEAFAIWTGTTGTPGGPPNRLPCERTEPASLYCTSVQARDRQKCGSLASGARDLAASNRRRTPTWEPLSALTICGPVATDEEVRDKMATALSALCLLVTNRSTTLAETGHSTFQPTPEHPAVEIVIDEVDEIVAHVPGAGRALEFLVSKQANPPSAWCWSSATSTRTEVMTPASGRLGELAHPAHPAGGRVGVVAELLCHPAGAATGAELPQGPPDCLGDHGGGWGVRWLQRGGEQRLAPCVGHGEPGHRGLRSGRHLIPSGDLCLLPGR